MQLIEQGGILMWPLLFLSVATLAVILERLIAFTTLRLADAETERRLLAARGDPRGREAAEVLAVLRRDAPAAAPLAEALLAPLSAADRERAAAVAIEDVVKGLDRRVSLLGMSGRVSPLLGLLGTVLGMIQTFSRLSSAQGAIDMTTLADGIWQALLTTAAGLFIAIPAVIAQQGFLRREERVAYDLGRLANLMLVSPAAPAKTAAEAEPAEAAQ